jgi:hypothetical protein
LRLIYILTNFDGPYTNLKSKEFVHEVENSRQLSGICAHIGLLRSHFNS